jgi:hypothetical protein
LKSAGEVSPEALQKWSTWNTDKQGGYLAGQMRTVSEKKQQEQINIEKQKAASTIADQAASTALTNKILGGYGQPVTVNGKQVGIGGARGPEMFPARDIAPANANQQITDPKGNPIGERGPDGQPHFYPKETVDQLKQQREDDADAADKAQKDMEDEKKKAAKGKVTFARGFPEMTSGSAPATSAPVKVATPAEAAKLPKGTRYIAPDGTVYTR